MSKYGEVHVFKVPANIQFYLEFQIICIGWFSLLSLLFQNVCIAYGKAFYFSRKICGLNVLMVFGVDDCKRKRNSGG